MLRTTTVCLRKPIILRSYFRWELLVDENTPLPWEEAADVYKLRRPSYLQGIALQPQLSRVRVMLYPKKYI